MSHWAIKAETVQALCLSWHHAQVVLCHGGQTGSRVQEVFVGSYRPASVWKRAIMNSRHGYCKVWHGHQSAHADAGAGAHVALGMALDTDKHTHMCMCAHSAPCRSHIAKGPCCGWVTVRSGAHPGCTPGWPAQLLVSLVHQWALCVSYSTAGLVSGQQHTQICLELGFMNKTAAIISWMAAVSTDT